MKPNHKLRPLLLGSSILASLAISGSLQAAVTFTVVDFGPVVNASTPPTTNLGSESSSIAAARGPITYTVSGLNFTSIGGTNSDQVVFTVSYSTTAGTIK